MLLLGNKQGEGLQVSLLDGNCSVLCSGDTCVGKGLYWGEDAGTSLWDFFDIRVHQEVKTKPTQTNHRRALVESLRECADFKKTHPDAFCSRVLKLRG